MVYDIHCRQNEIWYSAISLKKFHSSDGIISSSSNISELYAGMSEINILQFQNSSDSLYTVDNVWLDLQTYINLLNLIHDCFIF